METQINEKNIKKLTDICETALIVMEARGIQSFSLSNGKEITVKQAKKFTDDMFQAANYELD